MLKAAAEMGMCEQQFYHTTPAHFMRLRKAWLDNRQGMEEARFLAFYMLKTVDPKNRLRRFTDVHRFPWEKAQIIEFEPITKEELDRFSDEADEVLKKTNPKAYERYLATKGITPQPPSRGDTVEPPDPDFVLNAALDF